MKLIALDPDAHPCVLHRYHSPLPWATHQHHVVPLAWTRAAGAPESRTVPLCPTGHDALHRGLQATLTAREPRRRIDDRMQALIDEAIEWAERQQIAPSSLVELHDELT